MGSRNFEKRNKTSIKLITLLISLDPNSNYIFHFDKPKSKCKYSLQLLLIKKKRKDEIRRRSFEDFFHSQIFTDIGPAIFAKVRAVLIPEEN